MCAFGIQISKKNLLSKLEALYILANGRMIFLNSILSSSCSRPKIAVCWKESGLSTSVDGQGSSKNPFRTKIPPPEDMHMSKTGTNN